MYRTKSGLILRVFVLFRIPPYFWTRLQLFVFFFPMTCLDLLPPRSLIDPFLRFLNPMGSRFLLLFVRFAAIKAGYHGFTW